MKKNPRIIILSLVVFLSLMTVIKSFYYSCISGGTDLRNRVVGARAMAKGYSPYFYKWKPEDGERLLDPNDMTSRLINHNSVTPAVFYAFYPLTFLNYPNIRFIWTILQLLAGIAIVWMMLRRYEGTSRLTVTGIVILGLLASDYWFMHVERGQIQIFYALLFAFMFYAYKAKWKYAEFISGFIGGLFIFFRPFASMIGLGFVLHGKMNWVRGCTTGVIAGVLIFVVPDPLLWGDYFKAMAEFGNECIGKGHIIPGAVEFSYPAVIEGTTNMKSIHDFHASSMHPFYGIINKLGFEYTAPLSYVTCGSVLIILSIFFFQLKSQATPAGLFLFGFLTYKVEELFIINYRTPYSLVLWIFPLFLIVQQIQNRPALMIILFTALFFLHYDPFEFHYQVFFGETILLSLVTYFAFSEFKVNKLNGEDALQKTSL